MGEKSRLVGAMDEMMSHQCWAVPVAAPSTEIQNGESLPSRAEASPKPRLPADRVDQEVCGSDNQV